MIALSIAPDLMEEAILLAERGADRGAARAFRRERDRIYDVRDPDARDAAFHALNLRWFERFGLQTMVEAAINEHAGFAGRLCSGRLVRAMTRSEEGADLVDAASRTQAGVEPLLVVRLRPESIVDGDALRGLMRHELMHVADMLDPDFGYERSLPSSEDGPSADNILRDWYRVVWDATIEGRLARAGVATPAARDLRWREFRAAFSMLEEDCLIAFDAWWAEPRPTHAAIRAFAMAPAQTGRCPVCRFPVTSLDDRASTVAPLVRDAIREEHPSWRVEQGLCSQCLDLYEARYGSTPEVVGHH